MAGDDGVDTGEIYDCVVVGGRISGLAAAMFFARQAGANRNCLLLENHAIFGGEHTERVGQVLERLKSKA